MQFEKGGLSASEQADLQARGHKLKEISRHYGNMHAIELDRKTKRLSAASDPRGEGEALVFSVD